MMSVSLKEAIAANQRNWDERAGIHFQDDNGFYRVEQFKAGADVLGPLESVEVGDVAGLDVLHLQCHFGLDTLSLARRGACVTGLDFSTSAIETARRLAHETGLAAEFIRGDVHQVRQLVESTFDLVYATWGVFCWIPDAKLWIRNAASLLKPGGRLYIADDHPVTGMLEENASGRLEAVQDYSTSNIPERYEATGTYTGVETPLQHSTCYEWRHSLEEFTGGATDAGLQIIFLHEHFVATWQRYSWLQKGADGLWHAPADKPRVPLTFSMMARKRASPE